MSKGSVLEVHTEFESNRNAEKYLEEAYERICPSKKVGSDQRSIMKTSSRKQPALKARHAIAKTEEDIA